MTVPSDRAASGAPPAAGDGRAVGGDGPAAAGTSGWRRVTSGVPLWAFGVGVGVALAICTVNVFSELHDRPRIRPWEAATWEYSSGLVTVLLLPFTARAMVMARSPATGGWARFLAVHAIAVVLYSLLHVGGFVALRVAVYAAVAGWTYRFGGLGEWVYELRKDALSYGLMASVFAFARALARTTAPTPVPDAPGRPAARFDIRDGARVIRPEVVEIAAATSAGNYVEFHLADGRKPLMRTTLAAVEKELRAHGFLRTHRSWLVNGARVREIAPSGSGDMRLVLDTGLEAPLSRRYPEALEALKR